MNDLRNVIKESKTIKKELVASTVRMPKELHSFIEGLADQLTRSKQEVMLMIIEEGVKVAEEELNLDTYEEVENNAFYMLNTNRRHDRNDHDRMVKKGIAAAFYDPWKFNIDRIKKGNVVFLYENGVGIVAYGKGSGVTLRKDRYGDKDECHYQKLSDFHKLGKPIPASEVKKILGRNIVFLRTMSGIPDGQKILDAINGK
jgi:predicted DNA-binding protein